MADLRISDLVTASQLKDDDYYEISQSESGTRVSYKATLLAIAVQIATMVDFTSDLNTTSKKITGAINELKQLISLIPQFSIEVVQELPTEDISDTTIYLVPAEDPEVGNYYEEYIHVNNTWELVGTTAVDLSAYYTKLEVDGLLATKASVAEVALKENKTDMPTDVRTIIKDCKTPKSSTITNGIAQFECIEENLVKALKLTMEPIQDLHGYDHPWAGGAGKNKLPFDIAEIINNNQGGTWSGNIYTYRGITFTPDSEGRWKATGTATEASFIRVGKFKPSSGSYLINGVSGGSGTTYRIRYRVGDGSSQNMYNGDSNIITVDGDTEILFELYVSANYTANITFYPMIRLSSVADSTFEPYENICPISGRTKVELYHDRCGVNTLYNGQISSTGTYSSNANSLTNVSQANENTYFLKAGTHTLSASKLNTSAVDLLQCTVLTKNSSYTIVDNFATEWNSLPFTFTTTEDAYLYFTARKDGVTALSVNDYKILIDGKTHTHQYGQTVYGGEDDFVNGGATSEYHSRNCDGTEDWQTNGSSGVYIRPTVLSPNAKSKGNALMSIYKKVSDGEAPPNGCWNWNSAGTAIQIRDERAMTASAFKTLIATDNNLQICYELATPTTIQTSAEEITTVAGTNIISGTEPISECKYTELATVDDLRKIIGGQ